MKNPDELKAEQWLDYGGEPRECFPRADVDEAIAELKGELESRRQAAIDIKLSAEKVLRDLLDCGLIKEWYFNGKFNAIMKADDPHLEIAKLKAENAQLKQKLESAQASMYCDVVDANMDNRRLKEERRWRKFSDEKPEHHQWILVFYPNHSQFTTGVELRRWDDGCKYDVEFQEIYEKWMPLPEPPKEADK